MLRVHLIAALERNFEDVPFTFGVAPDAVAILPSPCPEVGTLTIYDDGDEATVDISEITHGHFNSYDESLSDDEHERSTTGSVVGFLRELFADRVLLFRTPDRRMGGWQFLDMSPEVPPRETGCEYFVWSGPAPAVAPMSLPGGHGSIIALWPEIVP